MKKLFLILTITIVLFSCKSERDRKIDSINMESIKIIKSLDPDLMYRANMTAEGSMEMFKKISDESAELGLKYANELKFITDSIKLVVDSLDIIARLEVQKAQEIVQKRWEKTKAGKIQKKHPYWSKEDCERVANNEIWIGMDIEMVICERGRNFRVSTSNYGNGNEYQYCWSDYTTSCFYTKSNDIVYSYN